MKKHTLILVAVAIIIGFAAFWIFGTNKAAAPATPKTTEPSTSGTGTGTQAVMRATITYENDAFTPNNVTLAPGGIITWVNNSSGEIQIGADPHPTHTGNREISNGEFTLSVPAGGQATSKLTKPGKHGFHNHLNPSSTATVTVQ